MYVHGAVTSSPQSIDRFTWQRPFSRTRAVRVFFLSRMRVASRAPFEPLAEAAN
jgi:hypothetical protein